MVVFYNLDKYNFAADNVFENSQNYTYGAKAEYKISNNQILNASFHADNYHRYDKFENKDGHRLEYQNNIIQPQIVYTNTAIKNKLSLLV